MNRISEGEIIKQCIEYFKQNPVWKRVFEGFREKYSSYGRFAGKVVLNNLSPQEIDELEGFFGKSFHGQKNVTVSAERFGRALEESRFKEVTPEALLEQYFGELMIGKQEQKALRNRKKQQIIREFIKDFDGTCAAEHVELILETVRDGERCSLEEWEKMLRLAARIYNQLPYRRNDNMYLAAFAAELTGNPHAFDRGTSGGTLFYKVIQADLEMRGVSVESSDIFPAYRRKKSCLETGIMLDDISNYVMVYNVRAINKDGSPHKGMEGFEAEHNIVQVPLAVITGWKKIQCRQDRIYIVENPSVFAMLCAKDGGSAERSYMCMNGQPRLAGLMALDLMAEAGNTAYYAGDMDPEGLLIAQKLGKYYKGELNYWHMEVSDYEKCMSHEKISPKRMKILENITDERLRPAARAIGECKMAGYQEMIDYEI